MEKVQEKQITGYGMALGLRSVAVIDDGLGEASARLWQAVQTLGREGHEESGVADEIERLASGVDALRARLRVALSLEKRSAIDGGAAAAHGVRLGVSKTEDGELEIYSCATGTSLLLPLEDVELLRGALDFPDRPSEGIEIVDLDLSL